MIRVSLITADGAVWGTGEWNGKIVDGLYVRTHHGYSPVVDVVREGEESEVCELRVRHARERKELADRQYKEATALFAKYDVRKPKEA